MDATLRPGCVASTSGGVQLTLAEAAEWCASGVLPEEPYLRALKEHPDALERYAGCAPDEQEEWRHWTVGVHIGFVEIWPYSTSWSGEIVTQPKTSIGGRSYSVEETEELLRDYTLVNVIIHAALAIRGEG